MTDQRRQLLSLPKLGLLMLAATASFPAGACFNGLESDGLPCENDAQCGPGVLCLDGFCGGSFICDDGSLVGGDEACDGEPDCPDGEDEDPEFCDALAGDDGDGETFECADGGVIPLDARCDGEDDCEDGSDEGGFCGGLGINECSADSPDLAYELGPSAPGTASPLAVEVVDFMGSPEPDAVFAGAGDTALNIAFDLEDSAKNHTVNGTPSFDGRGVVDYELGLANDDMSEDLVIATVGDNIAFYVFQNLRPEPPALYGAVIELPEVLKALDPQIQGIELGQLDGQSPTDMVAIVDTGDMKGRLVVGFGDADAAEGGGAYFSLNELPTTTIGYTEFYDSELVDLDGDGLLDLLVVGSDGNTGKMWVVPRDGQELMAWGTPETSPAPLGEITVGRFANTPPPGAQLGPQPDFALLDPVMGLLVPVRNQNGTLMPQTAIEIEGAMPSGLVIADFNCDGNGDFAYHVANPPEIQILFGDGEGGVTSETPLVYASDGTPSGGLGVGELAGGPAPDIFVAVGMGSGMSELRVLLDQ